MASMDAHFRGRLQELYAVRQRCVGSLNEKMPIGAAHSWVETLARMNGDIFSPSER